LAIYHLSIKIISRGKGRPAVVAAAYRAAEKITSNYDGITNDYTRKGGVVHTEIMLPERAPPEYADRAVLWNAVEKIEKAKNAQLAREIELALPKELSLEKNITLVRNYVKRYFVEQGMCADICIHDKGDGNPHTHIMLTMRPFNDDGTWGDKQKKEYIFDDNGEKIYNKTKRQYKCKSIPTTDWNEQTKAEEWRSGWAECVNKFLESENVAARIDHRSYKRQDIEQIPTIHLGVSASQMERHGIRTERGDINREIILTNQQLRQLRARINKLKNWLNDESVNTAQPTLADVISNILSQRGEPDKSSNYNAIVNLKKASQMLLFLKNNHIKDMPDLQNKVGEMYRRQNGLRENLKPIERRLKVLQEHIWQAEYYTQFKDIYNKYKQQNPKNQEVFYEDNRAEITLYEAAKKYLDAHLNGHSLPLKDWKLELTKLTAEQNVLYREYTALKDETREVELIKRNVENILHENQRESTPVRKRGLEL